MRPPRLGADEPLFLYPVQVRALGFQRSLGTEEEFREVLNNKDLWHPRKAFGIVAEGIVKAMPITYEAIASRYVPGETVVVASTLGFGARIAQEKLSIPTATVHLQPGVFRSVHQSARLPGLGMSDRMPKVRSRRSWLLDNAVIDPKLAPKLNAFRAELGLPPVRRIFDGWRDSPQLVLGLFPDWVRPAPTRLAPPVAGSRASPCTTSEASSPISPRSRTSDARNSQMPSLPLCSPVSGRGSTV